VRPWLPAVLLALAVPSLAAAQMSSKQFGSGGGYTPPNAEAGDYLENAPRREVPAPPAPAGPTAPAARPAPKAPAPVSRPAAPAPRPEPAKPEPKPRAPKPEPAPAAMSQRVAPPSLWNGLVRPVTAEAGEEAASAQDAARYDGQAEQPALAQPQAPEAATASAAEAAPGRDALFVSIEVDPGEAGTLRDAVAGLGAAGFSPDTRFEARAGAGRASIITGWLPAARLGEAVTRPGVRRVSIETSARPSPRPAEVEGAFLLGLRVPDAARAEASIAPALQELSRDAGLKAGKVLGIETAPDGRMVAVVSARLPLSRLSKALARADVVKLVPAPAVETPSLPMPPSAARPTPGGFAKFMAKNGLWLVALTILVALVMPAGRAGIGKGLEALVPYH
jgi:hypothetical protein